MIDKSNKISGWNFYEVSILYFAILIVLFPFLLVSFPPSTDLPQHLSQIQLLKQIYASQSDQLIVNWFAPNNLIYVLIAVVDFILPSWLLGKSILIIICLCWIVATVYLAKVRGRPIENVLLSFIFIFNASLYWGFLNFLIGWPFFALFLACFDKPNSTKNWLVLFFLSLLLFLSHALWFLMACVFIFVYSLFRIRSISDLFVKCSPMLPVGLLSAVWFRSLSDARFNAGFDTAAHWFSNPIERLSPTYVAESALGGIKGFVEPLILLIVLAWIIFTLYSNRSAILAKTDKALFLGGVLFFLVMLFAPEKYMNTIFFSQRWLPFSFILLSLALPAAEINRKIRIAIVLFIVLFLVIVISNKWYLFEKKELSGLERSLISLPENKRVIGLDFVKTSEYLKGRPFLQTFSYAQAYKGGQLNFSFAEHSTGIVIYKEPRRRTWTPGLEWIPERVTNRDIVQFDYALVNGFDQTHLHFSRLPYLKEVTKEGEGRWRLYEVVHEN